MSRVRKDQSRSRAPLSQPSRLCWPRSPPAALLACWPVVGTLRMSKARSHERINSLLWAVAWKQTAAEYAALCHQAYNLARYRLDAALASREDGDAPLAVIRRHGRHDDACRKLLGLSRRS